MQSSVSPAGDRSWRQRLGNLPLFYRVLLSNTIIVVTGAIAGTTLTLHWALLGNQTYELVMFFAAVGTIVSVLVNWVVLRAALRPLATLEQAVDQVRRGNFRVRAQHVRSGDREIDALIDTFNNMLDAVERYRSQLHELSMRSVTAQEEERKRVSRELHDDTAQALTAQLLRLKAVEARGGTADPAVLADLIQITAQTLEGVRHMAHELRPPSLDDLGLLASLEGLAAQYQERFGLPVRLHAARTKRQLPPQVNLVVYRIVQEALTNVAKHAGATEAIVTLDLHPDRLEVRISDDGLGFNPDSLNQPTGTGGLGIFGMHERAALVSGALKIDGAPGEGTTVHLTVPLTTVKAESTTETEAV